MPGLLDFPTEVLELIPLEGLQSKDIVRVSRHLHTVFTPQLYRSICFEKKGSPDAQPSPATAPGTPDPSSPRGTILRSARAVHLWLHTLCAEPRLQQLTQRLCLTSDLSLADHPPGLEWDFPVQHSRKCEISICRRYSWTTLARLPNLRHVVLSAYWQAYFVSIRCVLPALRTFQSVSGPHCRALSLGDSWSPRNEWDVYDLLQVAAQPALQDLTIYGAQIISCQEEEAAASWWSSPQVGVVSLVLDGVEVRPAAIKTLLQGLPQLASLRWRRVPDPCSWQSCHCDNSLMPELRAALGYVQTSLAELHLEVGTHDSGGWQSRRCIRDSHILPTLDFLPQVTVLKVASELLLGRQICHFHPLASRLERHPSRTMAAKLPSRLRQLTIVVDVMYARYEPDYRQNLVRGILRERPRLSALVEIIIDDRVGDIRNEDFCGQCAVHDQSLHHADLRQEEESCGREGIRLVYRPRIPE